MREREALAQGERATVGQRRGGQCDTGTDDGICPVEPALRGERDQALETAATVGIPHTKA